MLHHSDAAGLICLIEPFLDWVRYNDIDFPIEESRDLRVFDGRCFHFGIEACFIGWYSMS